MFMTKEEINISFYYANCMVFTSTVMRYLIIDYVSKMYLGCFHNYDNSLEFDN